MTGPPDVLLFLLLDLAIIILAARACGALARRVGQPAVIGEIVAGLLLGPTALGRLFPSAPAALFPREVPLGQFADLGLVFFMFLVGLELDPQLIRKEGRRALAISLGGVILPFALGALLGGPLLALNNGGVFAAGITRPPSALAFSLFMGAAMSITAFPVLARILVERGLYKAPLGTAALCAAAVGDVIAWVLLAAVVGITRTSSIAEAWTTVVLAGVFAVFMLTAGRRLLAYVATRQETTGRLTVDQVATVVVGLFLSAYVTERIGIHAIFGAFIFGTIMPRESRMSFELLDKIEDFTVVVLLPVFFAVAGLRTNLFSIDSPELFLYTLVIIAAAIAGKLAGCGLAAKFSGYSSRDSLALGTLMNTRGLTELVILSVGLSLGVLSDRTFAMMVVMALVTTFMATPIVNRIMPRREMVRLLAGGDPRPMARRILVALGALDSARALIDAGLRLMGQVHSSELLLVRLIPTARAPEFRTGLRDEARPGDGSVEAMNTLVTHAVSAGAQARAISFLSDDVGQDLAYVAATQQCGTMLIGWHRESVERHLIRAIVRRVSELAPCNVAVFVDHSGLGVWSDGARPVLVAATGEDEAVTAEFGQRLADSLSTCVERLRLSHLGDAPGLETVARESANAAAAVVAVGRMPSAAEEFGEPASAFVDVAQCPVLVVHPATPPHKTHRV